MGAPRVADWRSRVVRYDIRGEEIMQEWEHLVLGCRGIRKPGTMRGEIKRLSLSLV